jgi:vacuolar-type H+-ATPase subunit B/Vma2
MGLAVHVTKIDEATARLVSSAIERIPLTPGTPRYVFNQLAAILEAVNGPRTCGIAVVETLDVHDADAVVVR